MQAAQWIELLQKIPTEDHEILLVGTASGIEISLQSILRIEPEYLLVRGRLSGTTEQGRVFILPYDRLTYLHFTREVPDEKLMRIFGELLSLERGAPTSQETAAETPEAAPTAESPQASKETPAAASADLRERLRARMAQISGSQGPRSRTR
jgi:hypothetical protein